MNRFLIPGFSKSDDQEKQIRDQDHTDLESCPFAKTVTHLYDMDHFRHHCKNKSKNGTQKNQGESQIDKYMTGEMVFVPHRFGDIIEELSLSDEDKEHVINMIRMGQMPRNLRNYIMSIA